MKKLNIKRLIKASEKVIAGGSLDNGAIVAANPSGAVYPSAVQDYGYVWVRDAAYVCMAADLLGLKEIPERFFDWCLNRTEGFRDTGLFYNAYSVNGALHGTLIPPDEVKVSRQAAGKYAHLIHHGTQFQPDQNGTLLIAINHHIKHFGSDVSSFAELIATTASGICNSWNGRMFTLPCFDLWEERCIPAKRRRYHTYSLAMCAAGLRAATQLLGKKPNWVRREKEMSNILAKACSAGAKSIPRTYNAGGGNIKKDDALTDASMLGLIYPSEALHPSDENMKRTVRAIMQHNMTKDGGLLRYPGDKYCGGVRDGWVTLTGAGSWPLLSFWMSIYFSLSGDTGKAREFFARPLAGVSEHIPEQIFADKAKPSITPLLWSHAMFVIAAKFLSHVRTRTLR
ncbi:MAG: glycoside hydrolase family 15 protein [Planctomycetota bacterium]